METGSPKLKCMHSAWIDGDMKRSLFLIVETSSQDQTCGICTITLLSGLLFQLREVCLKACEERNRRFGKSHTFSTGPHRESSGLKKLKIILSYCWHRNFLDVPPGERRQSHHQRLCHSRSWLYWRYVVFTVGVVSYSAAVFFFVVVAWLFPHCVWLWLLQKEGCLMKYTNVFSGWARRYCKLDRNYFHYFENQYVGLQAERHVHNH